MKYRLQPMNQICTLLAVCAAAVLSSNAAPAKAQTGTSPVVHAFNFAPNSVDVSTQNAAVTFTMHVTDPAGIQNVYVYLSNSSFGASVNLYDSTYTAGLTGTLQDAYLSASLTVSQGSVPGPWTVYNVYIRDLAGNITNLTAANLTGAGFPTVLTVIDKLAAPKLTGFSFTPSAVDVTNGSQSVTFNVSAQDTNAADGYGIAYVLVSFIAPASCLGPEAKTLAVFSPSSGTTGNGVWTGQLTVPQFDVVGEWSAYIEVHDTSGAYLIFQASDLQTLGLPAFLKVTGPSNCGNTTSPYTTFTQGGWGTKPHGQNPGYYLTNFFNTACPGGIIIGVNPGNYFLFTSAAAIEAFLPQGSGPAALPNGQMTNPVGKGSVLWGQLLSVKLAVAFSNAGIFHSSLSALTVQSGPFKGYTVAQVVNLADGMVAGTASPPAGITLSVLNDCLDSINSCFDGGTSNTGFIK